MNLYKLNISFIDRKTFMWRRKCTLYKSEKSAVHSYCQGIFI